MKRYNILLGLLLATFLFAGCATTGMQSSEDPTVKYPASGYDLNQPSDP
jgi:uncharacterized lipoprotein YajG